MKKGKFIISMLTAATLVLTSAFAVSAVDTEETGSGFPIVQEEIPVSTDHVIPDADPNFEEMTLEEFQELYPDYEGVFSDEETGISPLYDGIEDPGYVTAKYDPPFEWVKEGDKWYLYSGTGTARQKVTSGGWYQDGNYWYCLYPNNVTKYDGSTAHGEMITGWEKIRGYWYYFNEYGQMATYWKEVANVYYYFNPGGSDAISGYPEGAMVTGARYLPTTKGSSTYRNYYLSASGAMQDWYYPLDSSKVGNRTVNRNIRKDGHNGIDIDSYLNEPIYNAVAGTVRFSGYYGTPGESDGTGNTVIVVADTNPVLYVRYFHMSQKPLPTINSHIDEGDAIGYVGSTGYSTGKHLHMDVSETKTISPNGNPSTLEPEDAKNPAAFFPYISFIGSGVFGENLN